MTDEKLVTEREKIEAERAAFIMGLKASGMLYEPGLAAVQAKVERLYPLPKVTRPRTYKEGAFTFRVMNGVVVQRTVGDGVGKWYTAFHGQSVEGATENACTIGDDIRVTPTLLAALADLLANPTEEVDG